MYSNSFDDKLLSDSKKEQVPDDKNPEKQDQHSRVDRQGRVLLPFWTNGNARKQLKYIAIEEETTQQNLMMEALNLLFQSRGRPPIA